VDAQYRKDIEHPLFRVYLHRPYVIQFLHIETIFMFLAKTKRRAPKKENGKKNMFCGLLYCADCESLFCLTSITQTNLFSISTVPITDRTEELARQRTILFIFSSICRCLQLRFGWRLICTMKRTKSNAKRTHSLS